jgi:Na+/H+ antiporter NhaD/arsenite permease-like protein
LSFTDYGVAEVVIWTAGPLSTFVENAPLTVTTELVFQAYISCLASEKTDTPNAAVTPVERGFKN